MISLYLHMAIFRGLAVRIHGYLHGYILYGVHGYLPIPPSAAHHQCQRQRNARSPQKK